MVLGDIPGGRPLESATAVVKRHRAGDFFFSGGASCENAGPVIGLSLHGPVPKTLAQVRVSPFRQARKGGSVGAVQADTALCGNVQIQSVQVLRVITRYGAYHIPDIADGGELPENAVPGGPWHETRHLIRLNGRVGSVAVQDAQHVGHSLHILPHLPEVLVDPLTEGRGDVPGHLPVHLLKPVIHLGGQPFHGLLVKIVDAPPLAVHLRCRHRPDHKRQTEGNPQNGPKKPLPDGFLPHPLSLLRAQSQPSPAAHEQKEQGGRADIAHAEHPQRPGPAIRLYQYIVQHGA